MSTGNQQNKTTISSRIKEPVKWFLFDAAGKTLGRISSEIANVLSGKHKPTFTPHADTGDGVIVINAQQIVVTGHKAAQKNYHRYTGYQSGLRTTPYATMLERKPEFIIEHAVKGMMAKTKKGRAQFKRLRVYRGAEHKYTAQQPIAVNGS
jgi:large subunit ribosomal protein L13